MNLNLFDGLAEGNARPEQFAPGATLLRGVALGEEGALLSSLRDVIATSPLRHMVTPGGYRMSVAMTNCGPLGWVSDRSGYRYEPIDPLRGSQWPPMPDAFGRLASKCAALGGFAGYTPDACLINQYEPGAKLTLHQDKDERDFDQPIVSVSLGLPATFLFGGLRRSEKTIRIPLEHGDVVVWGGPSRLAYHGVLPLKEGHHPLLEGHRINLTFRKAG